jgi:DNA-binding transcriptional regulator YhcF (GntR family)
LRSRDRNALRSVAEEAKEEAMTTQEFAANLESLIASVRHEGLSKGEIIVLLREAIDTVLNSMVQIGLCADRAL